MNQKQGTRMLRPLTGLGLVLLLASCTGQLARGPHASDRSAPPPGLFGQTNGKDAAPMSNAGDPIATGTAAGGKAPPTAAEFYAGTGRFLDRDRGHARIEESEGGYSLNFAGADIRKVADSVLGETLGLSYAIDEGLEGTVTARSAKPLPREAVLPALEDILAMNGAALVRSDGMYRIVPMEKAQGATPIIVGQEARQQGFGLHVIPLSFASADALQQMLEPFVVPGRGLVADPARNLLLFRGPGNEARDLVAMVDLFDVDWMDGMSFAILPLASASAADVIRELEAVFGLDGDKGAGMQGVIRFLPIERMNAVLAISEQPSYLTKARDWAERLDRGGGSADLRQLYVVHLKNARASEIAEVMGELFDVRTVGSSSSDGFGELAPGRTAGRLSGSSGATDGGLSTAGESGANAGPASGPAGGSQLFSSASRGATAPRSSGGGGRGAGSEVDMFGNRAGEGSGPRIIADERNDAMLVLATAQEYRMIEATIKRLDVVPLQVLIEATIAEVTLNDMLRFGVRWFFDVSGSDNTNSITFSDVETGAVSATFPGFSYLFQGSDARIALNALSEITDVTVVSSPQLMVLDNRTARLQVGDQVPVPTRQAVSVIDPNAPIVNSIEFQDTGVILEVTPHVNASGLVVLDVQQEVSDVVATTSSGIDAPTIQQRAISSTVAVQTGDTIALGGLIRDRTNIGNVGVPFLMNIPLLGNLFKEKRIENQRTELLVLLTPKVVRDRAESRAVTEELRRRLQGLKRLRENFGLPPEEEKETGDDAGTDGGGR